MRSCTDTDAHDTMAGGASVASTPMLTEHEGWLTARFVE
jgi:hypothetical protein